MTNNQPSKHDTSGFTLIELLVVVSLTVILMLAASTMFITFMVSSAKFKKDQKIKEEGDFAISQMEFMIRNAKTLPDSQSCVEGMGSLTVESLDSLQTTFDDIGPTPRIASSSGGVDYYLTSEENELSNFNFDCYQGDGVYYIQASFQLKNGPGPTADRETAIQNFSTGVTLRKKTF